MSLCGYLFVWLFVASVSHCNGDGDGGNIDPCVTYSNDDTTSVTLQHTWNVGYSEECICHISSSKEQDFVYSRVFYTGRLTLTLRARVDNKDFQEVILPSGSIPTTDFIEIIFNAPPDDRTTVWLNQLFMESSDEFKVSCRESTAGTSTLRPPSATIGQTSTTSRTSSPEYCYPRNRTIIIAAFRNIEKGNLPGCYGRSCLPKEGYADRDCVYSGGRCMQVASASDLLWMYGNCFTSDTSGNKNGCPEPSTLKFYAFECLDGKMVDPCEGVDVEVSRVLMVHSWSSDDPHVNCTCNVQSARKQPFNVTGLNVYQQNRNVLWSTLEFAGQSIRHSLFPLYTHRIHNNTFQITFDVRPSAAFRENHQPVAYQFLTLHAEEPFRLTCLSPGTPPQTPPPTTEGDATGIIIPIVAAVAGLGMLLVIAVCVGCVVRRRKRNGRTPSRATAITYAEFPTNAASVSTDPQTVNNAYAIAQPLDSSVALLDATSGVAGNGPTAREETYTEIDLSDNPQHSLTLGHGQVQASKIESNTYGELHHGGGQPSAGTSDSSAIYSHTTSSDIYNVLQRQPEKRVVVDNVYNTTNDV